MKGKTSSGFKYEVDENVVNDWRFIKTVNSANSKDDTKKIAGYINLVTLLLGEDGEERLCEHVKHPDGHVPNERISEEIVEIMQAIGEKQKK